MIQLTREDLQLSDADLDETLHNCSFVQSKNYAVFRCCYFYFRFKSIDYLTFLKRLISLECEQKLSIVFYDGEYVSDGNQF